MVGSPWPHPPAIAPPPGRRGDPVSLPATRLDQTQLLAWLKAHDLVRPDWLGDRRGSMPFVLSGYCQYNDSPCILSRAYVPEMVGISGPIVDGLVYCLPSGAPSWPWHKVLPIKSC